MTAKRKKINKSSNVAPKNPEIPDINYPIFDFRYLHPKYSLSLDKKTLPDIDRVSLINQLYQLSKFSWQEIIKAHRHGLGTEKIAKSAIKPSMPNWIEKDTVFLALRYNGLKEIVGIRNGNIFHILYIDYNRTVYDH